MPINVTQAVGDALQTAHSLGIFQKVVNWRIGPRVHNVLTSFQTTQPTIPIVEVFRDQQDPPGQRKLVLVDVRFPILGEKTTSHKLFLGEGSKRLNQGHEYVMTVTAPATQYLEANPKLYRVSRKFTTLRRRCKVTLHRIRVRVDGDPGGSGEMEWSFAVYDGETGERLADPATYKDNDAGDGKHILINIVFNIEYAPDTIKLFAYGIDRDRSSIPLPGTGIELSGLRAPEFIPSEAQVGQSSIGEWAEGIIEVEIPDYPVGHRQYEYTLASKWGGVSYYVDFRVDTEIWAVNQPSRPSVKFGANERVLSANTKVLGSAAGTRSSDGKFHFVAPGSDNRVMYMVVDPSNRREHKPEWKTIAEVASDNLALIADRNGRVHMFTLNADGAVRSLSWRVGAEPDATGNWHELGGRMQDTVYAAASDEGTISLVARGQDGMVYHGTFDELVRDHERWSPIARLDGAILSVLISNDGSVHVFGQERAGQLLHTRFEANGSRESRREWKMIENVPEGELVFGRGDDNSIAVISAGEEGSVYYKEWEDGRWRRGADEWASLRPEDLEQNEQQQDNDEGSRDRQAAAESA